MNRAMIQRWAILWASSGMSVSDLEEFIDWIESSDRGDAIRSFVRTRNQLRNLERGSFDEQGMSRSTRYVTEYDSLVHDIQRLIRSSGLTTQAAAKLIASKLAETDKRVDEKLEYNPKEGLRRWLVRLARERGPGEILSAALEVLQKFRGAESDWRLG